MNNDVTIRPQAGSSLGRIDQYELIRELGGGGFGCVYLAKDTVAGIEVAVKGLPPLVRLNKEELENVRTNFALVSRLHHPNIAAALTLHPVIKAIYDDKTDAEKLRVFSGDTLVVMQYARGVTLSQWRKQFPEGKVPLDKALEITRQIASALDYAHTQRIIHRDIKPANVIIETDANGKVMARVLDFGIAAEIRSSLGRVSREVTDTSGTRPYMAPEQWLGKKQGERTDQYSLAVLFYELIVGEVPFASVFETGDPVIMMNVVRQEVPEFPHDISEPLRQAMLKALSKKQEERFSSCLEFTDAVSQRELQSKSEASFSRLGKNRDKAKSIDSEFIDNSEFIDKVHLLKQVDQTILETEKISFQSRVSKVDEYFQAMSLARKEMDGVNLSRCREIQESIELLRDKINEIVYRNDIQMRASKIFDSIRDRTKDCAESEIVQSKLDVAQKILKKIKSVPIREVDDQLLVMRSVEQEIKEVCCNIQDRRAAIAYAQDLVKSISCLFGFFQESDVLRVFKEEASDILQRMKESSTAELLESNFRLESIKQEAEEEWAKILDRRAAIASAHDLRRLISSSMDSCPMITRFLVTLRSEVFDVERRIDTSPFEELSGIKSLLLTLRSRFNLLMMEYQRRRRLMIVVFVNVFIVIPILLILCGIMVG